MTKEMGTLEKAYKRYIKQANSINLSEDLKKKVRDGTIDITLYDGDTLDKIKDYQEWYEKALDAKDKIGELREDLAELYQDRFDITEKAYEDRVNEREHQIAELENKNDAMEYAGGSRKYDGIRKQEEKKLALLNKEADSLQAKLDEAVASGTIKAGSEAWYDMKDAIAKVREEAQETAIDIAKSYKDAFDSVEKEYKNKLGMISHEIAKLNNQIAATEYNGEEADYVALRIQEQQTLTTLNKEAADLQGKLDAAVASGKIAEGSDAWYEMKDAIAAVEEEAQQTALSLAKSYKDAFDSVEKAYKNILSSISHEIANINNQISASEYTGKKRDFDALRAQEERSLDQLYAEADALEAKLQAAVYTGRIKEGSAAWYEMKDAIAATREEAQQTAIDIAKSYKDAFDDVENTYNNKLSTISHILTNINNQMAASEYDGSFIPFDALRNQEENNFKLLNEEADALQRSLDEAVASGKIIEGSDAWYDMRNAIVSVREEAQQTAIDIAKSYKDAFDSVEKMYENRLSLISRGISEINNRISASEYTGELGNYEALRAQQTDRLKLQALPQGS